MVATQSQLPRAMFNVANASIKLNYCRKPLLSFVNYILLCNTFHISFHRLPEIVIKSQNKHNYMKHKKNYVL